MGEQQLEELAVAAVGGLDGLGMAEEGGEVERGEAVRRPGGGPLGVLADPLGDPLAPVSELGDPRYVGTALTLQTSLGFLLTLATIRLVPPLTERFGWGPALAVLALGPAFGIRSMLRLRRLPEAERMASGNR